MRLTINQIKELMPGNWKIVDRFIEYELSSHNATYFITYYSKERAFDTYDRENLASKLDVPLDDVLKFYKKHFRFGNFV